MESNQVASTVVEWNGRSALVRPAGNIVAALVPEFRAALREAVRKGLDRMTIDFSRVDMVDSTGIGVLISAHNSVSTAGGKLFVIRASKQILELFRAMRIHQHFSVSGDGEEGGATG